ncbi:hypothetical protein SynMVIR181_00893 [Synechococcus sp. MVIR-18-1]|nr:hypothetical protein SynMVIR181_00893 [Synechococcus sp. MVIR-18-1]
MSEHAQPIPSVIRVRSQTIVISKHENKQTICSNLQNSAQTGSLIKARIGNGF